VRGTDGQIHTVERRIFTGIDRRHRSCHLKRRRMRIHRWARGPGAGLVLADRTLLKTGAAVVTMQ
jgi:hypothetical protein